MYEHKIRKKLYNSGFTLVELVVVLVLMSILAAVSVPAYASYQKGARYSRNTAYAQEIFAAAQAGLAGYRASGLLDQLGDEHVLMIQHGDLQTPQAQKLQMLLKSHLEDTELLQGSMAVEIDCQAGIVLAAYYYDGAKDLSVTEEEECVWIGSPSEQYRKEHALGCYTI